MVSTKTRHQHFAIAMVTVALAAPLIAFGSPTSDEFKYCVDRSSETLKSCLYRNLNKAKHNCWEVSKDLLEACNQQVIDQYKR